MPASSVVVKHYVPVLWLACTCVSGCVQLRMHAQVSAKLDAIARAILAAMENAHGLPGGTFLPLINGAAAQRAHCLDAMQYDGEGGQLGKEAHADKGVLTLIWTPVGSALQVGRLPHACMQRGTGWAQWAWRTALAP